MKPNHKIDTVDCYHCGLSARVDEFTVDEKDFCCQGCILAYEILSENDLYTYYELNITPGTTPSKTGNEIKYGYLDDEKVIQQLVDFSDNEISKITLFIPTLHCSSCIWLLENLFKINSHIHTSKVDFLKKKLSVTFNHNHITIRELVELLASLGYEPEIHLKDLQKNIDVKVNHETYIKIGVAGFCFGNIMLLSLPEYLSISSPLLDRFHLFFGWLNIALAIPVLLVSARGYFVSAWKGIRYKTINMDVPISLGIISLFIRSLYEIIFQIGPGWMDSFSGLVFLLLIGKLFQDKTYQTLSFDRDYKSYFPISVIRKTMNQENSIPLNKLKIKDVILIRNNEIIPSDSLLKKGHGTIDYSFVTGESKPVQKHEGDVIYAGGKQVGETIELEVLKDVSQSYLTQLWNHDTHKKHHESQIISISNDVSKYFTMIVLGIAIAAAGYWSIVDPEISLIAFSAVLIIACPCALALSTPFTLGTGMRILAKNHFYIKNTAVIETLSKISHIIFDKTGTLTHTSRSQMTFHAIETPMTKAEKQLIKSLTRHSNHPLSRKIYGSIDQALEVLDIVQFKEIAGEGIQGIVNGSKVKIGSKHFIGTATSQKIDVGTGVFILIDGHLKGYYTFGTSYREGILDVIKKMKSKYQCILLSGDNDRQYQYLLKTFGSRDNLLFNQTPFDKLKYIKKTQNSQNNVLMIGDGLNDAGALLASDVGISIADDINAFSPACDGILKGDNVQSLAQILKFSQSSIKIIKMSFLISFLYNLIGLSFAVTGTLSPLISAVLMPISSITVVLFTTITTNLSAKKLGLKLR